VRTDANNKNMQWQAVTTYLWHDEHDACLIRDDYLATLYNVHENQLLSCLQDSGSTRSGVNSCSGYGVNSGSGSGVGSGAVVGEGEHTYCA